MDTIAGKVVSMVAEAEDTTHKELTPLNEVINTDALRNLFPSDSSLEVRFTYEGHDVIIHEGEATLQE
jgi:hypothetical protein